MELITKNSLIVFAIILLLSIIVWGVDSKFYVNINMEGNNITNVSHIAGFSLLGNIDGSGYNASFDDIDMTLPWESLSDYPAACTAGFGVSTLADSPTCTEFMLTTGETVTGYYNFSEGVTVFNETVINNVTHRDTSYECWGTACVGSISWNGSALIIKVN